MLWLLCILGWESSHLTYNWEICISLFFCVICICFPGDLVARTGYVSLIVDCGCCGLPYVLGTVGNSLESHFGHDRAKNDSEFVFLGLSYDR